MQGESNLADTDAKSSDKVVGAFQGETSGVSGEVGKNSFVDEKTPDDALFEKVKSKQYFVFPDMFLFTLSACGINGI